MLSEVALAQADLTGGWEVMSPFSYGYQGGTIGNVTDTGGSSYIRNGTVTESAIIIMWRYGNASDADFVYSMVLNIMNSQAIPFSELPLGDRALIYARDMGSGPGYELVILNGNDIIFVIYSVSSGTALEEPAISLAELQLAKIASLA
jgi:hypothetical protein